MAIRLQATPSVVVWSVNEETLPDAKSVAAAVSADRCSVQVLCEGGCALKCMACSATRMRWPR